MDVNWLQQTEVVLPSLASALIRKTFSSSAKNLCTCAAACWVHRTKLMLYVNYLSTVNHTVV